MSEQAEHLSLSILIPTYNQVCVGLVKELQCQAAHIAGLDYEIIVGDDGSTSPSTVAANQVINTLPHCRYITKDKNMGRAAIRNFLARTAQYHHLLFADSHMSVISNDYLAHYLQHDNQDLVDGGYTITDRGTHHRGNLRYAYEMSCIDQQRAEKRARDPYGHFHTSNFMVRRDIMIAHPLDERFKHYGYEDVLWGKSLKEAGIHILHIDNPLGFNHFECNERFMEKTDEGLQTLCDFQKELKGYSRLLDITDKMKGCHLIWLARLVYRIAGTTLRRHLTGSRPTLVAFKIYRMCRFCQLDRAHKG